MENAPDLPWGKIAAVAGALLTIHVAVRVVRAAVSMASQEARYRLTSGDLPMRHRDAAATGGGGTGVGPPTSAGMPARSRQW